MIRNLKAFGLALVAMLTLGAVVASGALAQQGMLTTDTGEPVTLDATEGAGVNAFTFNETDAPVECPGHTLTGHKTKTEEETPGHELIPNKATTATITPHYENCHVQEPEEGPTHKVTVTMNGCDYHLYIGETAPDKTRYEVEADLECPPEKVVEVHIYPFANTELGGSVCTITVKEQTGLKGPTLKNTTTEHPSGEKTWDLDLEGTFTGIHAEKHGSIEGCNGTETTTEAKLHVDYTVEGTDDEKNKVGITVSDE